MEIKYSPKGKIKRGISDAKNKSFLDHSPQDENKGNIQKENNNYLKTGQRYVNDLEINEIFTNKEGKKKENIKSIKKNIIKKKLL